jgi:hypothetical protein
VNGERTRILLTLTVVVTLGALVALLRRRRKRRQADVIRDVEAWRRDEPASNGAAAGAWYVTLGSLEEARTMDHTAVILRGGGDRLVYLTAPVKYVGCDGATLVALLHAIDALEHRRIDEASVRFELAPIGSGVAGGTDGGSVIEGVWLHPRLAERGILPLVSEVVTGQKTLEEVRAELARLTPGQRLERRDPGIR